MEPVLVDGPKSAATPLAVKNAVKAAAAPPSVLDQLQGWLDVDDVIYELALGLLAENHVSLPPDQTSRLNADGSPRFGRPLPLVRAFIDRIADVERCFQFIDDYDARWWVSLTDDHSNHPDRCCGVALGGEIMPFLVNSAGRENYRATLNQEYTQLRKTQAYSSEAEQQLRSKNCWFRKLMTFVAGAARLMPAVYQAAAQNEDHNVQIAGEVLAAAWWGSDRAYWPRGWLKKTFNAVKILLGIWIATIIIPKSEWAPQIIRQRSVISEIVIRKRTSVSFRVDPDFVVFLGHCIRKTADNASQVAEMSNESASFQDEPVMSCLHHHVSI